MPEKLNPNKINIVTLLAENYEKALKEPGEIGTNPLDFRVEDEEGNEE